ncbi:peptidylprolyl isomerase [Sphingomicrobium sediminis]|uniref:Peptidyl-prolyl cis-trans isomerase n=1 Tax=Sphingomicrobium sediminis TaxID=2950949 RepID=A0A9X2EIU6_9SPHN|nr:peptidylprolyl isomerase [Sphingomicrobium sediminis]MCM8556399.1 peptidylprolyl isomerase [Sphingomicrobium sediminis]
MFKLLAKLTLAATALSLSASPLAAQDKGKINSQMPALTHRAPAEIANDPSNHLYLTLDNGGTVEILLRPDAAPNHVHRIQTLASAGFYDGIIFHRVIPGFMAQGGDPTGTGTGGSTFPDLEAEFNRLPHLRGVVAMARAQEENSANSQFYIMFSPRFRLDEDYTVVGRVVAGMDVVDRINPGEPPVQPTKIVSARIGGPVPPAPLAIAAPEAVDPDEEG